MARKFPNGVIVGDGSDAVTLTGSGGSLQTSDSAGMVTASIPKTNFAATSNPGTGNDTTQSYSVGSRWINTTTDEEFVCADASTGAAVWMSTTAAGSGVPTSRILTAGTGLTGGGDLSADRTFNVAAHADGSIVVNADDVQVGVLATDAQHGTRGGGTQHAAATGGVAGFMSAADKTKLDGVAAGATSTPLSATAPVNVTKAAAAAGTAVEAARQDHKHDVTTAAPAATGVATASGEGVATSLARSDHTHQSNTAPVNVTKAAAAIGTSGEPARADHKHDVTTAAPSSVGTTDTNAEGASTSLARADHVHEVFIGSSSVAADSSTTTASGTPSVLSSMTVTPAAGTYLAMFSGDFDHSDSGDSITIGLYVNTVLQAGSERTFRRGAGQGDVRGCLMTMAVVTPAGAQAVDIRWSTTVATATSYSRSLVLIRLT